MQQSTFINTLYVSSYSHGIFLVQSSNGHSATVTFRLNYADFEMLTSNRTTFDIVKKEQLFTYS